MFEFKIRNFACRVQNKTKCLNFRNLQTNKTKCLNLKLEIACRVSYFKFKHL